MIGNITNNSNTNLSSGKTKLTTNRKKKQLTKADLDLEHQKKYFWVKQVPIL